MFTHQRPAIASRYSVPSASTTVEPWPSTITIGSASSCRCATAGCSTLSRSCRTTAARPLGAGAELSGVAMSPPRRVWAGLYASRPVWLSRAARAGRPTSRCMAVVLLGLRQEVIAPVPGPAGLVVLIANRALLAVAHDRDPGRADALGDEVVHRGLRAPLAERQIVGVGAPLVGVALDQHLVARVGLQPAGVGVEEFRISRTPIVPVALRCEV